MDNQEPQARQQTKRAAFVLQMVLLFLMMALAGLIGLIWFGGERLLFPPTPTATATTGAALAPTADFRATLIAEDIATQEAYSTLAVELGLSPLVAPTKPAEAVATAVVSITVIPYGEGGTPATIAVPTAAVSGTLVTISLPMVANASILPTPTPTPVVFSALPTETPTLMATDTAVFLPTETPTLLPPTPTLTPTPTFFVQSLRAVVVATPVVTLRSGPSNLNSGTETLPSGTVVNLTGRDETGEWVQVLLNNTPRWFRQVYAPPRDNQLQAGAPAGSNPNDIRWLKVDAALPTTVPIITPTAIPDNSFPRVRRDRANSGRLPKLPTWPLTQVWPNPNRANRPMNATLVVANDKVFVTSEDNYLYALGTVEGNQQWRQDLGAPVRLAPSIQDSTIYLVDTQRRTFAIQDQGMQGTLVWQNSLPTDAVTSLFPVNNRLYVIGRDSAGAEHLYGLDRGNGAVSVTYNALGEMRPVLTFGNQLVYIGDPDLRALDMNDVSVIWTRDDIENLLAPPVFMLNGPNALAELYVVDQSASGIRLHALNANTGQTIWVTGALDRNVNGLAVGDSAVYITADNYMRAIVRQGGNATQWEIGLSGQVVNGPLLDGSQILVVTTTGNIQAINNDGQTIGSFFTPNGQPIGTAAVYGPYLYITANDSIVYAYRGQQ